MNFRKHTLSCSIWFGLGVVLLCVSLLSCGGGGSNASFGGAGTVQAAGFTTANVAGGYAFSMSVGGPFSTESGVGVITADGKGNITAGEETVHAGSLTCHVTLSGIYMVNADGFGTSTINVSSASVSRRCHRMRQHSHFNLALADGGRRVFLTEIDPRVTATVIAVKQ